MDRTVPLASLLHIAVVLVALCCLPLACGALFVADCIHTTPREVAEYHLVGPPELLAAVRCTAPLALAAAACAVGAIALALVAIARGQRASAATS
jgi:hypothetical protein